MRQRRGPVRRRRPHGRRPAPGGGQPADSSNSKSSYKPLPAQPPLTPHGGEYVSTETNYYEVVYMPLQTRIYLFDNKLKPLSPGTCTPR